MIELNSTEEITMDIEQLLEDLKFDADTFSDIGEIEHKNMSIRCIGAIRFLQEQLNTTNKQLYITQEKQMAWCPDVCPITFRPFFMWIGHPTKGVVPTYGGPFDSYTIPEPELPDLSGGKTIEFHDVEFTRLRYDHDEGGWRMDEVEDPCMRVIHDDNLWELQEKAERCDDLEKRIKALENKP